MRIRYLRLPENVASVRLRQLLPAAKLAERHEIVYEGPSDVLVLQKHGWAEQEVMDAKKIVFDICDDHFDHPSLGWQYRTWVMRADAITCNSRSMRDKITIRFGRAATVIDDPYETEEEGEARCGLPALWFGHATNLHTLEPIIDRLPPLVVVSNAQGCTQWSPESMRVVWAECGIVVLPTGHKQCKSANRAVESIRNGLYPCTGPLPAYSELGLGTDNVPKEVRERLDDPEGTKARIRDLQAMVRDRFSVDTVAKAWEKVLSFT